MLYDGAETVLAGNAEAFLGGLVAATARASWSRDVRRGDAAGRHPRPASGWCRRRSSTRALDGRPFMVAGTFGFVLSLPHGADHRRLDRERAVSGHLRPAPAHAGDARSRSCSASCCRWARVFAIDVVLMMLVAGFVLGVWPQGSALFFVLVVVVLRAACRSSLGLIFSATSATPAEAVQKTVLVEHSAGAALGLRVPDPRTCRRPIQWVAELFPATHYIRVSRAIYLRGAGPLELWPELCRCSASSEALLDGGARCARWSGGVDAWRGRRLRHERAGDRVPRGQRAAPRPGVHRRRDRRSRS